MKRFLLILLICLFVAPAWAADVVQTNNGYASYVHNPDMKTAIFTVKHFMTVQEI